MESIQNIKQRFGIIGQNSMLNRAIEKALLVAPSDISVLVVGESGVGKEFIPKIIHALSVRKHQPYTAVNCGAIPEGTMDSELFGHEKGSFTGATHSRKGYFEVSDKGTIFLDEVGELPLFTQVRLLRVLESGEFLKVGASQSQKTDVRVVAATNVNMLDAVRSQKFREDLYYRLNTIQIDLPSLRERKEDIYLLYLKFAQDFAEKYHRPMVKLTPEAISHIENYYWPGNVRQLKNFAEQLSVISQKKEVGLDQIVPILPEMQILGIEKIPQQSQQSYQEREIFYKVLLDLKKDINDLRLLTLELLQKIGSERGINPELIRNVLKQLPDQENNSKVAELSYDLSKNPPSIISKINPDNHSTLDEFEWVQDYQENNHQDLSIHQQELELINKVLLKHHGKRKLAAEELGISERTLYRKIKQFNLG